MSVLQGSYLRKQLIYVSKGVVNRSFRCGENVLLEPPLPTLIMANKWSQRRRQDGTRLINTCLSLALPAVKRE